MVSDTAKAKQAVLEFLRERGQGTSSELIEAIRAVLGDHFTEGKAAGAIRMCVEDGRSGVYRLDRGVYAYQPAEVTALCADAVEAADDFAQKAYIDQVMREALELAKGHIAAHLDLYTLDAQLFAYATTKINLFNQVLTDRGSLD